MRAFVKPPALCPGDTIAIVAPASGMAVHVRHRLQQAVELFRASGYRVQVFASVGKTPAQNITDLTRTSVEPLDEQIYSERFPTYCSADAVTRARDLMDAFLDDMRAVVCAVGGWGAHELLEYLDFDAIRRHPKIFVGFSGATSLHCALQARAGLVSFYGPSAVCQFGEFPAPMAFTLDHFWRAVARAEPIGAISASLDWSDDKTTNWFTAEDVEYVNKTKTNPGYEWLRGGRASGVLLGGCLPVLLAVRGTSFMPDLTDAILLLETPESDHAYDQGMPLSEINMVLGCLRIDGSFSKIRGLVVGRVFGHSEENVNEIKRLIKYHTRDNEFPILFGIDTGHSDPILTLPLGCHVTIESDSDRFCVDQSAVELRTSVS